MEPADKDLDSDLDSDLDRDLTEDDEYEDLEEDEDLEDEDDLDEDDDLVDEEDEGRSARTNELWADARIDPIEIALPGGVGYTLRAYRPAHELTEISRPALSDVDDYDAASAAVLRGRR